MVFGQELILDLYNCDQKIITSHQKIKNFIAKLCNDIIKMKRYGPPLIPHFGHTNKITSGYSLVQLIETSSVTAHFSEYKKAVYLNIFSCAKFDSKKTAAFCQKYFGAKKAVAKIVIRN